MKSMRPEDRPKAIALSLGVVVVFILVFMRMSAALGGTAQPAPNAPLNVNIGSSSATTASTGGEPAPSGAGGISQSTGSNPGPAPAKNDQIDVPAVSPAVRDQDPFRDPQKTSVSGDTTSGPAAVVPQPSSRKSGGAAMPAPITEKDIQSSVPGGLSGTLPKQGGAPALPSVGEMRPDEAPMSVTGIVDGGGGRTVAVIRIGSKDYVVTKGDHFGNGYRLAEAHETSVVVTKAKERRVLKMDLPDL